MPRQKEETERSEGKAKKSGNRRRSRQRYADKLAPALLDGASAAGSVSRFFAMRSLWCASRKVVDSRALFHFAWNDSFYFIILTSECTFSVAVLCVSLLHCENDGRRAGKVPHQISEFVAGIFLPLFVEKAA